MAAAGLGSRCFLVLLDPDHQDESQSIRGDGGWKPLERPTGSRGAALAALLVFRPSLFARRPDGLLMVQLNLPLSPVVLRAASSFLGLPLAWLSPCHASGRDTISCLRCVLDACPPGPQVATPLQPGTQDPQTRQVARRPISNPKACPATRTTWHGQVAQVQNPREPGPSPVRRQTRAPAQSWAFMLQHWHHHGN